MMSWTVDVLRERLDVYKTSEYDWNNLSEPLKSLYKAAVLVPLVIRDDQLFVWLTKRSHKVGNDKGHVSFPGGMRDEQDVDAVSTALREADEEIGLKSSHVITILATLPPWINIRNTLITPVVALISEDFCPQPNDEVDFAFLTPLETFLSTDDHWSSTITKQHSGEAGYLHFFSYSDPVRGHEAVTFGLTATMCITVSCAVIGRSPQFSYSPSFQIDPANPFISQINYLKNYKQELNVVPDEFKHLEQSRL